MKEWNHRFNTWRGRRVMVAYCMSEGSNSNSCVDQAVFWIPNLVLASIKNYE